MVCKDAVLWRGMCVLFLFCGLGAKHVTPNFEVEAPTAAIAEKVALTAERCREELANQWLGYTLPNWSKPCPVRPETASGPGCKSALPCTTISPTLGAISSVSVG